MTAATTTRFTPVVKPFSWSFSRLKNYETCPKRSWHLDIKRDVVEPESEQLMWGNTVHKALAERVAKGTPLPAGMKEYEPWVERIFTFKGKDVRSLPGLEVLVEQKWAITKDFEACGYFDKVKQPWLRVVCDVGWIVGPVASISDYKTGKIVEDSVQLTLTAAVMFAHYPQLQVIRSTFAWLKEDAETSIDIRRDEIPRFWGNMHGRIEQLREAHEQLLYPPTPNRLCRRWCPVKQCPHNGESY